MCEGDSTEKGRQIDVATLAEGQGNHKLSCTENGFDREGLSEYHSIRVNVKNTYDNIGIVFEEYLLSGIKVIGLFKSSCTMDITGFCLAAYFIVIYL